MTKNTMEKNTMETKPRKPGQKRQAAGEQAEPARLRRRTRARAKQPNTPSGNITRCLPELYMPDKKTSKRIMPEAVEAMQRWQESTFRSGIPKRKTETFG